jgi:hypothetical protein
MSDAATRTRYASDTEGKICLLLDIRGQARDRTLQVFSYGKNEVVSIPRFRWESRVPQIVIETPHAKRWAAVTVPRWYRNKYGLFNPPLAQVVSGFCQQNSIDTRTDQEKRDDSERSLAQYVVDRENRYRRLPGQKYAMSKRDYVSARAFQ